MYEQITEISKVFEKRIYLANQFYEKAIRRAHNEYYDALTQLTSPDPVKIENDPIADEPLDKIIDLIFKDYDTPASGALD